MNAYKLLTLIVVSVLVASLLASALNNITRVTDSALAQVSSLPLDGGGGEGWGPNAPRTSPGKSYLPIIFLNGPLAIDCINTINGIAGGGCASTLTLQLTAGGVISGSLLNELTVNATTAQYGNPTALHGIAGGSANLFPAIPIAVWGESHTGAGLLGASDTGNAVLAYSHAPSGSGVYGSNDSGGDAVHGNATTGNGVYGTTANSSASVAALYGVNTNGGYGVVGLSSNISVFADNAANSTVAYLGAPCCAADLYGAVNVTGNFNQSNGTKNFMMDDPLDPANKYLLHAAVEAPDMINFYNGIAILDAHGEAIVQLPQWFGAINTDFRYQLTAVGAPMPNLYVAGEIRANRFKIAGGAAGGKVSWQVTGTRNDAWAAQHPFQAEQDKPVAERGTYLYPQGFSQPITNTIRRARYGQ